MATAVVGVDLGGTNVRAAVVGRGGELLAPPVQHPSRAQDGFPATLEQVVRTIREAIAAAGVAPAAIGMAVPGHIDSARGVVRWAPNFGVWQGEIFEVWREVPLADAVRTHLSLPVVMGNDANLAALGEYYYGVGRGQARGLVMLTLGTGIGGGVVLTREQIQGNARWEGGVLLVGLSGGAGELGHAIINFAGPRCGCGAPGCIEAYARRDAIVERAREAIRRYPNSLLSQLAQHEPANLTPALVSQAAEQGDPVAIALWDAIGAYLGVAIATFINIFNPEVVAIGGQIAKAGAPLFDAIHRTVREYALPTLLEDCTILPAERLEDAGILGGAALAWQAVETCS
ncbi:MAG: ROK family protein [Fimbriimonadales bacterium]|nr:ROK family protein [Fimbriimonadales bacterium]